MNTSIGDTLKNYRVSDNPSTSALMHTLDPHAISGICKNRSAFFRDELQHYLSLPGVHMKWPCAQCMYAYGSGTRELPKKLCADKV